MPIRLVAAGAALLLVLAACGGGAPATGGATGPADATAAAGTTAGPTATAGAATAAAIDLSKVDVCAIVPEATVEALTGETGFITDASSVGGASCFWAVPRAGVPQYLEVRISRRTKSLADYALNVNGVACPGVAVAGVGAEARGGVCTTPQRKIFLVAMDRGVAVEVIVNEPKGALTPDSLAEIARSVLNGLE